jgi:hypothetical protein
MRRTAGVDALLARVPADDPDRVALQSRAAAYSQDCGCRMGAVFLAGSLLVTLASIAKAGGLTVWKGIAGLVFVLIAAMFGKAVGLVLASLKLALLRRSISRRLRAEECFGHVDLH